MSMPPREDRRFRIATFVLLPLSCVLGVVSSVNDWSIGAIYLAFGVMAVSAVVFVHLNPVDRFRRRR
jgi:hypothetical protein